MDMAQKIANVRTRRIQAAAAPKPAPKPKTKAAPKPKAKAHANNPGNITDLLTPKQLDKETNAAVKLKYGPQEKVVAGQQRVSGQEQQNITDWFQQYKDAVAAAQTASAAYDTGAQAALQAQAQQAQTQAQQDPTQANSPEAQQAAAARRSTADSYGAMLAAQGSAHNTFFADKGRIAAGEETNQHLQEHNRSTTLAQQLKDLKGQEGEYATGLKQTARDKERTYLEEAQAFGLNVQQEKDKVAADRVAARQRKRAQARTNMEHDRQYGLDKQKFGAAQAKDNYQKAHGLGPYKPAAAPSNTASKKHHADIKKATGKVQTTVQDVQDALNAGGTVPDTSKPADPVTHQYPTRKATPKELAQAVGQKYSPMFVRIAKDVQAGKPLNSAEIAYLHAQDPNVRVPKQWLRGRGQTPPRGNPGHAVTAPDGSGGSRPT